ncbi:MAG: N-acetyltransferase [Bacteroidetes bacterium]|nr:N-acetyltransferase [Bacteroidota bacterium]
MHIRGLKFRLAIETDLEEINSIYNECVPSKCSVADLDEWDMQRRTAWFQRHDSKHYPVYVCLNQDQLIAWFSLSAYRPQRRALSHVAEISYFIRKEFQGLRVGTQLMEFAIKTSINHNKKHLIAILLDKNISSIKLLENFNFSEWGRMPGIVDFEGDNCDHLYYGLSL